MNFIKKNNQTTLIHFGFIDFYTGDYNRLYQRLRLLIKDKHRQCKLIGYINPHVYNKAQEFIPVKKFISDCDFVCIDGVGITLSARFLSGLSLSRVVATHLFDAILDCDDINACAHTYQNSVNILMFYKYLVINNIVMESMVISNYIQAS
jgi:UDP-N-acetyl-D-mannosaminuronic acid transferase (WecB/TagA/CpsF family)